MATAEDALRAAAADAKRASDEALKSASQDADKRVASKAEEGQKIRNDLKLQIAELTKRMTDERRDATARLEEKQKLESELDAANRRCADAREKLDALEKDVARKE